MWTHGIAIVVLFSILIQLWATIQVGRMRGKTGIQAPATSGHPDLERAFRVQMNHVEQFVMFFPALWLCQTYFRVDVAVISGAVFLIGRTWFALGYYADAKKRGGGFLMGSIALLNLLICGGFGLLRSIG
jgi:glutathione S-transferase